MYVLLLYGLYVYRCIAQQCDTGRWIGFDELQRLVNMNGRAEAATKVRDQLDAKAMTQVIKTRPLLGSANEVVVSALLSMRQAH